MSETLMTETATQTNEGQPASQSAVSESTASAAGEQATQQQQATEGQNTEGQQADGANADGEQAKAPEGAPEKYEFKEVEGADINADTLAEFSEVAKELGLPQDAAQKILDKMAPSMVRRQAEAIEGVKTQWAESARADKEYGGDKLNENLAVAKKALDAFGTPELRTLLNESGLGNHPEVIRFMVRSGKAISEDGFVGGTRSAAGPADPAKRLFPNQA
jgi:hypothetical protein